MTEVYKAQGNLPPNFKGEFTPRQQIHYDASLHFRELVKFLPPTCMGCTAVRAFVLFPLGYRVAKGEKTILDAAREVQQYSAGCTGPVPSTDVFDRDPSCPPYDKRNKQPDCW